jgi:2-hydroxychromene-2-carboxylate isomerase
MAVLRVDLYWSMRSPYCYLALERILELLRNYELAIDLRPVYPLAVRTPDFFTRAHRNYRRYNLLDTKRIAEHRGIPFRRPIPDPIVQNLATNEIAAEQPYIFRLTRLAMAGAIAGRGLALIDQVARMLWDGSVTNWHEGPHLAQALARAGLSLDALDADIARDAERYDAAIRDNQAMLEDIGHWGVPTLAFAGEPFFGQDRIDLLLWRLEQNGLKRRAC